eukprot:3802061-Pleurochrysis_carterae.AAC.1
MQSVIARWRAESSKSAIVNSLRARSITRLTPKFASFAMSPGDNAAWTSTAKKVQSSGDPPQLATRSRTYQRSSFATAAGSSAAEFTATQHCRTSSSLTLSSGSSEGSATSSATSFSAMKDDLSWHIRMASWLASCPTPSSVTSHEIESARSTASSCRCCCCASFSPAWLQRERDSATSGAASACDDGRLLVFLSMKSMRVSAVLLTPVSPSIMQGTRHSMRSFRHSIFIVKSRVSTNLSSSTMGRDPISKSNGRPPELISDFLLSSSMPRPFAR